MIERLNTLTNYVASIKEVKDVPKGAHYVIITFSSVSEPYDDRFGTTYSTRRISEYHPYTDRSKWEAQIRALMSNGTEFVALVANPVEVVTEFKVKIKEPDTTVNPHFENWGR